MIEIVRQPQLPRESPVAEVERPRDSEDVRTIIMRTCPQSGDGLSDITYLQAAISTRRVDDIAAFPRTSIGRDSPPELFR